MLLGHVREVSAATQGCFYDVVGGQKTYQKHEQGQFRQFFFLGDISLYKATYGSLKGCRSSIGGYIRRFEGLYKAFQKARRGYIWPFKGGRRAQNAQENVGTQDIEFLFVSGTGELQKDTMPRGCVVLGPGLSAHLPTL